MNFVYVGIALYLIFVVPSAPAQDNPSPWKRTIEISQVGEEDVNQSYENLLDYLFPRGAPAGARNQCQLVLRYIPADGFPHQLNLLFDDTGIRSMWAYELHRKLSFNSSEEAHELAVTVQASTWLVRHSPAAEKLLDHGMLQADVPLRRGAILHGNSYYLWGDCDLSHMESKFTLPPSTGNATVKWMDQLWSDAEMQK